MPSFNVIIALLVVVAAFGSWVAEAQDRSPEYARVTPADVKWSPVPSMPKGAQIAVLHGNPAKPGLFTIWVKLPANFKLPVHSHPDERVRTIISGTYYSAVGDTVDASKLMDFPPVAVCGNAGRGGSVSDHWHWTNGHRLSERW